MVRYLLAVLFFCGVTVACSIQGGDEINEYEDLKKELLSGWNTFDATSMSTQVMLPEGLALNLQINDTTSNSHLRLMFTGNRVEGSERVWTQAHTPDGSYTDYIVRWKGFGLRVQSHAENDNLWVLATPSDTTPNPGHLQLNASVLYGREGVISCEGRTLRARLSSGEVTIYAVAGISGVENEPILRFTMTEPSGYSTMDHDLETIRNKVKEAENHYTERRAVYSPLEEVYDAIQNALNWMVIYDDSHDRLVTPVARTWAYGWGNGTPGGYILFCWDNFFAAFMHSMESRELAFNEAIQMCREIDGLGFVPNFSSSFDLKSRDRSQPPVGGMMVREIYIRHPERWFLEETFDRLLTWNRWWDENRQIEGYLCWGSDPYDPLYGDRREEAQASHRAACYESGLDNSPMYEEVSFDTTLNRLMVGDVGLMGLYVGDCDALADLAGKLERNQEAAELWERGERYRQKIRSMWNEEAGMFLNHRIDLDRASLRISPTNFYALIARAATQEQAERMVRDHFYNPEEFWGSYIMPSIARNDPSYTGMDYWKGSIWAPMNFLVYMGFRNYELPSARRDLALKSRKLLLEEWDRNRWVRENYHAETGMNPGYRSEHMYHWGALLGVIDLMEHAGF